MPPASPEDPPRAVSSVPRQVQPELNSPEMQMRGEVEDPNSIAAISRRAQVQQAQTITDSEFDPPVPPARKVSGFVNGPFTTDYTDMTRWCCFICAIILLLLICWLVAGDCSWKKMMAVLKGFKMPRLFRGR
jgi:hypothetical protein